MGAEELKTLSEEVVRCDRERVAALDAYNRTSSNTDDLAFRRAREAYWLANSKYTGALVAFHTAWRRSEGLAVESHVPMREGVSRG